MHLQAQKYRDLKIWVWGHSRSLKMAIFDRSYTTYDLCISGLAVTFALILF